MSVLNDIKKMLGLDEEDDCFDLDIKIHINSAFSTLFQLGVGPKTPFVITGPEETWEDFMEGFTEIESVKTYVYLKVKMFFDPPQSSFVLEAQKRMAEELEWRLNVAAEGGESQNGESKELSGTLWCERNEMGST